MLNFKLSIKRNFLFFFANIMDSDSINSPVLWLARDQYQYHIKNPPFIHKHFQDHSLSVPTEVTILLIHLLLQIAPIISSYLLTTRSFKSSFWVYTSHFLYDFYSLYSSIKTYIPVETIRQPKRTTWKLLKLRRCPPCHSSQCRHQNPRTIGHQCKEAMEDNGKMEYVFYS